MFVLIVNAVDVGMRAHSLDFVVDGGESLVHAVGIIVLVRSADGIVVFTRYLRYFIAIKHYILSHNIK